MVMIWVNYRSKDSWSLISDLTHCGLVASMPQPAITKTSLKITYLKFHLNLPGVSKLIKCLQQCSNSSALSLWVRHWGVKMVWISLSFEVSTVTLRRVKQGLHTYSYIWCRCYLLTDVRHVLRNFTIYSLKPKATIYFVVCGISN